MPVKRSRKCKYSECGKKNILTPSGLKRWSGYCNRSCKTKRNQNHIPWLKKTIQVEFNALVREKGVCERCGNNFKVMQCSHIWSVGSYPNLRFDILNATCMCGHCHNFWYHLEPMESRDWFAKKFPQRDKYLRAVKETIKPWTVDELHKIREYIKNKDLKKLVRFST